MEELCGVAFGYAEAVVERLFTKPPHYETVGWRQALSDLDARFGNVAEILEENALREMEERTRRLLSDIRHEDPYLPHWAADSVMARFCYLACRLIQPETAIETGVAYGVSSAFILTALRENGRGTLYSVDLPPPRQRSERFWGIAVDESLRDRWRLFRGSSGRVLPELLEDGGTLDLFVHDSRHTRRTMSREFGWAWPRLREGGMVIADDVERNRAFDELRLRNPSFWRVVRDRETNPFSGKAAPVVFGISIK